MQSRPADDRGEDSSSPAANRPSYGPSSSASLGARRKVERRSSTSRHLSLGATRSGRPS